MVIYDIKEHCVRLKTFSSGYLWNPGHKTASLEDFLEILKILPTRPYFFITLEFVFNDSQELKHSMLKA